MNVFKLWLAAYEGEGTVTPPVTSAAGDPPPVRTFTQVEVNALMAENKKNLQRQNQEMAQQLEALRQSAGLTQAERDELATRIDTLQQQYLSKEELARQAQEKKDKGVKETVDNLSKEAKGWQERHNTLFKTQVITQAASEHNAFSTQQMIDYLSPHAEIVPQLDEAGKPTGAFIAVVPVDVEKEGKVERVKLPVPDAIKTMKTQPNRYGNFFKGDGTPGLGLTTGSGPATPGGKIEFSANMSEKDYAAWRKQEGLMS